MRHVNCIEIFEKPKWLLSKTGFWPELIITKYVIFKIVIGLSFDLFFLTVLILTIVNAAKSNNSQLFNWMICILISWINCISKAWTLIVNKKCFLSLMEDAESIIFNTHNEKLNKHVQLLYSISKILIRFFTLAIALYTLIASVIPIILKTNVLIPPPFEVGNLYFIYQTVHLISSTHIGWNLVALDVLYLTVMGLCVAQLNILKDQLSSVVVKEDSNRSTHETWNLETILRQCVVLHEEIAQYVKKLSILLAFPLFIQYTCGCVIICNTIIQLTILGGSGTTSPFGVCSYICIMFGQMAAYHLFGNEIIYKSNKIIEAAYMSKWYQMDMRSQKTLLVLMERAKKPLIIQLYSLVYISLDSLGVIIRWAYSVFAVIKVRY